MRQSASGSSGRSASAGSSAASASRGRPRAASSAARFSCCSKGAALPPLPLDAAAGCGAAACAAGGAAGRWGCCPAGGLALPSLPDASWGCLWAARGEAGWTGVPGLESGLGTVMAVPVQAKGASWGRGTARAGLGHELPKRSSHSSPTQRRAARLAAFPALRPVKSSRLCGKQTILQSTRKLHSNRASTPTPFDRSQRPR